MRINKILIFWASIISAVSLGISVILQCNCFEYASMQRTEKEIKNDDGTITKICFCSNQIVETLHKELTGKFYKIMYPHSKEEIDNAD